MSTTNLTNRPAANEISFAPECFVADGVETVFAVVTGFPNVKRFQTQEAANAYSKKTNLPVTVEIRPIMRRIRWN